MGSFSKIGIEDNKYQGPITRDGINPIKDK